MQYTTLALALAASAAAAPYTTPYMGVALTPPPTCEQFTLIFMVDGQGVSANAVTNGTGGPMVLQGGRPAAYPGTPAYFNSSDPFPEPGFTFKALNFILPDAVYGAVAPNIGDDQGVADNIWLEKDTEQFEWVEYNGTISHKLYAAPNGIYGTYLNIHCRKNPTSILLI